MKYPLLFVAIMMIVSSLFNCAQATKLDLSEQLVFTECTAYEPEVPSPPEDEILYGDANDDGVINVLDIIAIVNYIMGGNPDPFNFEAADVNNDGIINVLDIIFESNVIMEVPGIPCAGEPTVTYEGQTYNTVSIEEQCWFKENLNVGTMIISNTGGQLQTNNGIIEKYCYGNNTLNCDTYGGLYEWNEAMQYAITEGAQGICPVGWHIPTDNEWKILEGTVDSQYPVGDPEWDKTLIRGYDAGGNLKEAGTAHWYAPNTGATNSSGFTGIPGGARWYGNGSFNYLYEFCYLYSSSQTSTDKAFARRLFYFDAVVYRYDDNKGSSLSVRCLKDCGPQPSQANAGPDQLNITGTSTTLAGNTPTYGTGLWAIVSGTGGTIVTPTSPTSEFQGVAGNEYTLSWTITTACGSSLDEVVISYAAAGFTCGDNLEYEGQSYATVLIGTQCWFKENLNVGTKINSSAGGYLQTDNGVIEKYCYDNDEANCAIYGGLYEWPEAMQYVTTESAQGICPVGWHIPNDFNEWTSLANFLGGQAIAGGKMKSTGTIEDQTGLWLAPNTGATNESGFTGLPGGMRNTFFNTFGFLNDSGYFWSSSQANMNNAWFRSLSYQSSIIFKLSDIKQEGFSIRCLKD